MNDKRAMLAMILASFVFGFLLDGAFGCMCMPNHPQKDICRNDSFVALVRIKSEMFVSVPPVEQIRHKKSAKKPAAMILTSKGRFDKEEADQNGRFVPTALPGEVIIDDVSGHDDVMESLVRYRIKVHKAYKGFDTKGSNKQKLYIYSARDEGLCGRRLKPRDTYLIIGSIVDGRLTVGLCNHVIPWRTLPKGEKRNIRKNMEQIGKVCEAKCDISYCPWSNCKPENENECSWNKAMERKYGNSVHQANFLCSPTTRGRCSWHGATISKSMKRNRRHHAGLRSHRDSSLP
uniref:Metalloproteinase inhibitor 3-like n=1 Tax=Phallusia mammillata TaxID=59560 RepID=A0A6F9DVA8_9ASCI|nr:metalloproteinase inhibitor 3-like [Phallusia mammillata]